MVINHLPKGDDPPSIGQVIQKVASLSPSDSGHQQHFQKGPLTIPKRSPADLPGHQFVTGMHLP